KSAGLTRDQVVALATITVRYDDAQYPDNYEKNLKYGDNGYIEPIWRFEEKIDEAVMSRFGY
ncbi:hypothetical protein, partial [Vibrio anguillarum]